MGTQKGGSLKTLEGFRRGTTQICLENEDMRGGGGDRENTKHIPKSPNKSFIAINPLFLHESM